MISSAILWFLLQIGIVCCGIQQRDKLGLSVVEFNSETNWDCRKLVFNRVSFHDCNLNCDIVVFDVCTMYS